jgi:hypothetical protein
MAGAERNSRLRLWQQLRRDASVGADTTITQGSAAPKPPRAARAVWKRGLSDETEPDGSQPRSATAGACTTDTVQDAPEAAPGSLNASSASFISSTGPSGCIPRAARRRGCGARLSWMQRPRYAVPRILGCVLRRRRRRPRHGQPTGTLQVPSTRGC